MAESKDDDNEWLSYDGFMKKHHADLYPAADSSPVFQADTRGFHCIAEVLLTFPSLPKVVNAALSSSGSASPPKRTILTSSIVSHGYTSQNLHFAYHSEQGADHMIGRKVSECLYIFFIATVADNYLYFAYSTDFQGLVCQGQRHFPSTQCRSQRSQSNRRQA